MNENLKTGTYWLYLHPYVHLNVKKKHAVLYNSLSGKLHEYREDEAVLRILKSLASKKNLYVTRLKSIDITPAVKKFVIDIRKDFNGDIMETSWSKKKPIQFKPRLRLEQTMEELTFQPRLKVLRKDEIVEYLNVVNLYINDTCTQNCSICTDAYKQFLFCNAQCSKGNELTLTDIEELLGEVEKSALYRLNILGANILKHSQLVRLTEFLNNAGYQKEYYIHYLNFDACQEWLELLAGCELNTLHIFIHFPLKKEIFLKTREFLHIIPINHRFHFVIENEKDMAFIGRLIAAYNLKSVEFHPYFNEKNLHFFKENIFITKSAIMASHPTMREIFVHRTINPLDFKQLTFMPNKSIYANVNHPVVGKLGRDKILNLMVRELSKGKSWGKVRKNVLLCKSCAYNSLCPPISNYEYFLGRYNLCNIMDKGES